MSWVYLKICGTISKHGFTRLGDIVGKIQKIFKENETNIDTEEVYLIIPEFQAWFQENIFIAESTMIAWHLNEIRWGIYHYLTAEFQRAYTPTEIVNGLQRYRYDVPPTITSQLVKAMHWDLLNEVRKPPYFPRFTIDQERSDSF